MVQTNNTLLSIFETVRSGGKKRISYKSASKTKNLASNSPRNLPSVIPLGTQSIAFINEERRVGGGGFHWKRMGRTVMAHRDNAHPHTLAHFVTMNQSGYNHRYNFQTHKNGNSIEFGSYGSPIIEPALYLAFSRRRRSEPRGWKFLIDFLIKNLPLLIANEHSGGGSPNDVPPNGTTQQQVPHSSDKNYWSKGVYLPPVMFLFFPFNFFRPLM